MLVSHSNVDLKEVITHQINGLWCQNIVILHNKNLRPLVLFEVILEPLLMNVVSRVRVYPQQIRLMLHSKNESCRGMHSKLLYNTIVPISEHLKATGTPPVFFWKLQTSGIIVDWLTLNSQKSLYIKLHVCVCV